MSDIETWYSKETQAKMAAAKKEQNRLKFGCPSISFYNKQPYWYLIPTVALCKTFKGHPMFCFYFLNKEIYIKL